MPVKRKRGIARSYPVSPEALKRWREIRPAGIERQGPGAMIIDDELAEALGLPTLLWLAEAADALDRLEESA
jgi:hypothetical protein